MSKYITVTVKKCLVREDSTAKTHKVMYWLLPREQKDDLPLWSLLVVFKINSLGDIIDFEVDTGSVTEPAASLYDVYDLAELMARGVVDGTGVFGALKFSRAKPHHDYTILFPCNRLLAGEKTPLTGSRDWNESV